MVIAHNMMALNAQRQFNMVGNDKKKSIEKLSSGYRINRAADDAAGLAISEKMRRQIRGLSQGVENCQEGVSICQIADGALAEVNDMLHRMTELCVQAANGTLELVDREAIQLEINQLAKEIERVGTSTTFNEIPVFDFSGFATKEEEVGISLINSPSASVGYLSEAYRVDGYYYPSASMDFSSLDESKIKLLAGKTFSFACSQACEETFSFTFVDADGNQSKFLNPESKGKQSPHNYQIDIHGMTQGKEVLNGLFNCVINNPASNKYSLKGKEINVSHSNILIKENDTTLVIRTTSYRESTPENAVQKFLNMKKGSKYGKANFEEVSGTSKKLISNLIPIQYGTEADSFFGLEIEHMNGKELEVDQLDVTTVSGCNSALGKVKNASAIIARQRAKLGAQQNRLEHTIANENNVIENTTDAESRIRDTDMTKEIVALSMKNILEQSGSAMMKQANQSKQEILSLL